MTAVNDDALRHPITTACDVERFLLALVRDDPRPYATRTGDALNNVARLLAIIGSPQRGLRIAHIAGSKGKGSVALMLEALVRDADIAVGTYTSPHLTRWNERMRVDGEPVSDQALVLAMSALQPHVLDLCDADPEHRPSFFDTLTVAAMCVFREAGCQLAVLECGLGGRYDATNALGAQVSCITSIELEHTDKLGDTLAQIAWHKAGIAKRGKALVCGPMDEAPRRVIEQVCREVGAPLSYCGQHFQVNMDPPQDNRRRVRVIDQGEVFQFCLRQLPRVMAINAALALVMARRLGIDRPNTVVLSAITLPGRAQVLGESPTVMVDGAHTPSSLASLAESIDGFPAHERVFLVSVTGGKDLSALAALLRGAKAVLVTRADPVRSLDPRRLRDDLSLALGSDSHTTLIVEAAPESALHQALAMTGRHGLLCVCGSVYMAGLALRELAHD